MGRVHRDGFTLIELLVVVTIIVLLLAMLVPAMNKAIYQAQLVNCGAKLKTIGSGVTMYAFDNKRYYPDRTMAPRRHKEPGKLPINPHTIRRLSVEYDMRPLHSKIFALNKTLQCPLSPAIDMEKSDDALNDSEEIRTSYVMFWAWQYKSDSKTFAGMFKIGDRFQYDDDFGQPGQIQNFTVLAGDVDLVWGDNGGARASHPDRDPTLMSQIIVDGEFFIDGRITVASWGNPGDVRRGLIDTNYTFADGSVSRYDGVDRVDFGRGHPRRDSRMARAPINFDHFNNRGENRDKLHIPPR